MTKRDENACLNRIEDKLDRLLKLLDPCDCDTWARCNECGDIVAAQSRWHESAGHVVIPYGCDKCQTDSGCCKE